MIIIWGGGGGVQVLERESKGGSDGVTSEGVGNVLNTCQSFQFF